MTIAILVSVGGLVLLALACGARVIKRQLDGANLDRATRAMLESLPFLNRKRRRAALKAMRTRNRWERARQGFGSWFGVMHRSRQLRVKLSTPDIDP